MKPHLYYILSLSAAIALGACSSDGGSDLAIDDSAEACSLLAPLPMVDYYGGDNDESRSDYYDGGSLGTTATDFPVYKEIGVFLLQHPKDHHQLGIDETYVPYSEPDLNIKGRYLGGDSWTFSYSNTLDATFPQLFITRGPDEYKKADVYAYCPYDPNVTNLRAISVDRGVDFLWPEENNKVNNDDENFQNSDRSNKNLKPLTLLYVDDYNKNPDNNQTISRNYTIPLTFHHAMSLLQLRLKVRKNTEDALITVDDDGSANNVILTKATVTLLDKNMNFFESGIFDTLTGKWTDKTGIDNDLDATADANWPATNSYLSPSYSNLNFYLLPCYIANSIIDGSDDNEPVMRFEFTLNNCTEPYTYTVTRKELRLSGETDYGLRQGFRYIFSFYIENYLHIENVLIDNTWVDVNYTDTEDAATGTNPLTIDI